MENNNILQEDIEYIIVQNEETEEEIAKITHYEINSKDNVVIRIKYK